MNESLVENILVFVGIASVTFTCVVIGCCYGKLLDLFEKSTKPIPEPSENLWANAGEQPVGWGYFSPN